MQKKSPNSCEMAIFLSVIAPTANANSRRNTQKNSENRPIFTSISCVFQKKLHLCSVKLWKYTKKL
jgi:hypothetical protein